MSPSENSQQDIPSAMSEVIVSGSNPAITNTNGSAKKATMLLEESSTGSKAPTTGAGEKLSGAELKKRKQAEKAARRAQVKQSKEDPVIADQKSLNKIDGTDVAKKAGDSASAGTKNNHKRAGSVQKALPVRTIQAIEKPAAPQNTVDLKKVALFGHLYGQPRRTTIAAAGKDVHPAILSLGLQMSNYILCGSSVRCVAMLLAFKRVWSLTLCRGPTLY